MIAGPGRSHGTIESDVEVKDLSFAFGVNQRMILKNVSLHVPGQTATAVLGPSGSGKSTLLRLIAGLISDEGPSYLTGKISIGKLAPIKMLDQGGLAFMFQDPALIPHMTVLENVCLPFLGRPDSLCRAEARIDRLIENTGLRQYVAMRPHQLSGGTRTRVALVRSFVTAPTLLLLDEPFSALDIGWRHELYGLLKSLQQEFGCTIMMVTHDIDEAMQLCSQFVVLGAQGTVQSTVKVASVVDRGSLSALLMEAILTDHPAISRNVPK